MSLLEVFGYEKIYEMINISYKKIIIDKYASSPSDQANNAFFKYFLGIVKNVKKPVWEKKRDYIINVIKKIYPEWQIYYIKKSIYSIFDKINDLKFNEEELINITNIMIDNLYYENYRYKSLSEFEESFNFIISLYC